MLLIEAGANISATSKDGATPLFMAVQNGHTDVVKLIEKSIKRRSVLGWLFR